MIAYTIIFFLSFTGDADGKVIDGEQRLTLLEDLRLRAVQVFGL